MRRNAGKSLSTTGGVEYAHNLVHIMHVHDSRHVYRPSQLTNCIFTARRNARIASAVLATAIPSVRPSVRLSVTRRYCVKTTARSMVQFGLSDSKMCLVLYKPKIFPRDDPFP